MGAVVATAATLQAIQLAKQQDPANQPTAGECCMLCGACEFPCGDYCVPFGTMCTDPAGCACALLPSSGNGDPEPDARASNDCDNRLAVPLPGAD